MTPVYGITEEWKTANLLTDQPRQLKALVRRYNNLFGTDAEHQTYIISGSYGYKQTTDKEEIMESIKKEERLARIRFHQASMRKKKVLEFFSENERLPI